MVNIGINYAAKYSPLYFWLNYIESWKNDELLETVTEAIILFLSLRERWKYWNIYNFKFFIVSVHAYDTVV